MSAHQCAPGSEYGELTRESGSPNLTVRSEIGAVVKNIGCSQRLLVGFRDMAVRLVPRIPGDWQRLPALHVCR